MVKLKSKKVAAFLGVILLLVVASSVYVFVIKDNKPANPTVTTKSKEEIDKENARLYAKNLADIDKLREDAITSNIKDIQVLAMYKNLNTKDYDSVISVGSSLCKQAVGSDQYFCYEFYGQALAAKNDFAAYVTLGNEALQSPGVKANEIAVQTWNINLKYAKKGQNPYVITPEMDAEARL